MGDKTTSLCDAGNGPHAIFEIGRQSRDFRERPARAALYNPKVCSHAIHKQGRLENESAINPAHAHYQHKKHADADSCKGKAARIVTDVADG